MAHADLNELGKVNLSENDWNFAVGLWDYEEGEYTAIPKEVASLNVSNNKMLEFKLSSIVETKFNMRPCI